jgi:hypothetical protein
MVGDTGRIVPHANRAHGKGFCRFVSKDAPRRERGSAHEVVAVVRQGANTSFGLNIARVWKGVRKRTPFSMDGGFCGCGDSPFPNWRR